MTLHFDKLIDRYIPTDSGWNFHPDNTAVLTSVEENGKLVVDQANPLPREYKQLMYSNIAASGNATVYYLDMITSKDSGELPIIERDLAASNAKAIRLKPNTTMIFRTNYPYNKDRLKKVLCRCRKDTGATTTLHVGVVGIEDKAYKQPDGTYGNDTFYEVTVSGGVTESYVTYVGYIAGTDTVENIESVSRPNYDPDYPAKLLDGTTDIALVIKTGSGEGDIFVDSIELQDTENALTELPKGAMVVDSLEGLTDDNKLSPVEKAYVKTLLAEIDSEYDSVLADGTAAGVDGTLLTALTTKYNALRSVVGPLLLDMTKASDITSTFDDAFSEYYDAKTAVQSETSNLNSAALMLNADTNIIGVQVRGGELITQQIVFTLSGRNVVFSDVDWVHSDYGNPEDGFEYVYNALGEIDYTQRYIDCSTVLDDIINVSVSYESGTQILTSSVSITKVLVGTTEPIYLEATDTVPTITKDGALIEGDFFLYTGDYIGNNTPPDPEDLVDEYQKGDKKLAQVPTSEDNEFVFGRIYQFTNQAALPCTVGQTASNSIIISNESAEICAIGLTAFIDSETTRRTIGNITTYNASNKIITFLGGGFQTTTSSNMYIDVWKESRSSTQLSEASTDALRIAESTGEWLYVAVLVAQLGLFGTLLIEDKIESTNYASHMEGSGDTAKEVPDMGFKLNGKLGEILAYAMRAYEADIFGNLTASGFKTLQEQGGTTIDSESITPTLWKHSEMEALIASQDTLATLSGMIEGYSFTKATRRANQRVLLASHGYESKTISGGSVHYFTKLYVDTPLTGNDFYCEYKGYYKGNFSFRTYLGNVDDDDRQFSDSLGTSYSVAKAYRFLLPRRPTVSPPYFMLAHTSNALPFFSQPSHVDYHRVWTNARYTGLVLVSDTSHRIIPPAPNAYYPNTKTWIIGSATQADYDNYCSGTDFYNLFSSLAIGADGFCDGGQINVNGTPYTVTRLIKGANSITFYTSGGVVVINKFQEGTNIGVYTSLAVTQAINFQTVAGGIEAKHIFPWGTQAGSPGMYDIGTNDERFNTAYLSGANIKPAGQSVGMPPLLTRTVNGYPGIVHSDGTDNNYIRTPVDGLIPYNSGGSGYIGTSGWPFNYGYFKALNVAGPISGTTVNTGYGDNEVYRNTYVSINMTGYVQLGAMEFGETRHVHVTTSGTSTKRLLLPSGYSYLVWGITQTYDSEWGWGSASFSGGSFGIHLTPLAGGSAIIAQGYYDSPARRWQFLIRRIS